MTTKTFKACTHHVVGHEWHIEAPQELSKEALEELINGLIDYTDTPSNEDLQTMLMDANLEWHSEELAENSELYSRVTIKLRPLHREYTLTELEELNYG